MRWLRRRPTQEPDPKVDILDGVIITADTTTFGAFWRGENCAYALTQVNARYARGDSLIFWVDSWPQRVHFPERYGEPAMHPEEWRLRVIRYLNGGSQ